MEIFSFVKFLIAKSFNPSDLTVSENYINDALELTIKDFRYHYPDAPTLSILELIKANSGWTSVFLYRLGRICFKENSLNPILKNLHWTMKEVCSCEIYYSVEIGEGLYIRHGEGTIIGSRCSIGKGLVVHHGCTIGHKFKGGNGPIIGNDVELGVGSTILGEIKIGNNVKVGANSLVLCDIPDSKIVVGSPVKIN